MADDEKTSPLSRRDGPWENRAGDRRVRPDRRDAHSRDLPGDRSAELAARVAQIFVEYESYYGDRDTGRAAVLGDMRHLFLRSGGSIWYAYRTLCEVVGCGDPR